MPVPLARRLLFQNKLRLAASVVGVAVAVVLVLQNLALYRGIQRYASILVQRVGGDIWVVSPGTPFFELGNSMRSQVLYKVRSISGVESAEPLLYFPSGFECSQGNGGPINLIGIDPLRSSLLSEVVDGDARRLTEMKAVVVDRSIVRRCKLGLGDEFKAVAVGNPRYHVVGFTEGIRPLTTIPYAIMSVQNLRMVNPAARDEFTFVAVKAAPGIDVEELRQAVAKVVAPNEALTYEDFLLRHDDYWKRTADIRLVLIVTCALALFVGLLVVGQTVYSSTLEHLRQFGTLKAIGAKNSFVTKVVIRQALLAGAIGFAGGLGLSIGAGVIVKQFLPSEMSVYQVLAAMALVTLICTVSALAPVLKVIRLEPSEVFR
jgi:putative ABC transport system permease protein